MSVWSSGMIPALGAGGPGFKPRNGPKLIAFVPERSKGLDSSSSVFVLVGSNPIECIFLLSDGLVGSLLGGWAL